jgi:hypothetical protein
MNRLLTGVALALICTCGVYAEASQSAWDKAALPDSLRAIIHLNAADVPSLPPLDSTFLDPLQWPDSVTFLDRWFYLNFSSTQADVVYTGDKKQVIRPGRRVHLGYGSPWKTSQLGIRFDLPGGPGCSWNEFGRLYRRSWCEPDTVTFHRVFYETYPSGALATYGVGEREADIQVARNYIRFRGNFSPDGKLLGLCYTKTGQADQYWWKGRPISKAEWDKRDRQLRLDLQEEEAKEHRKRK